MKEGWALRGIDSLRPEPSIHFISGVISWLIYSHIKIIKLSRFALANISFYPMFGEKRDNLVRSINHSFLFKHEKGAVIFVWQCFAMIVGAQLAKYLLNVTVIFYTTGFSPSVIAFCQGSPT